MPKLEIAEQTRKLRQRYACYKVADLAVSLSLHDVDEADTAYIMQDGEGVQMKPYSELQSWLDSAMNRMAERLPHEKARQIRQSSACCISGVRHQTARQINLSNPTVDSRFEALAKERSIIGGNAWKRGDDYFISYWYAKPASGYTCACIRHVPKAEPMNKLWCECCAGHIKHHFETALGVQASCECVTSVLSSCGEDACLFKLNILASEP